MLSPSDEAILIWSCTDALFGMFIHSNLTWRIGWLRYVFLAPEMHRWHHVRDPAVRECNYGNNFSFCDWIFGTAYVSSEQPQDFGVDEPDYPIESFTGQFVFAFRPHSQRPWHAAALPSGQPERLDGRTGGR